MVICLILKFMLEGQAFYLYGMDDWRSGICLMLKFVHLVHGFNLLANFSLPLNISLFATSLLDQFKRGFFLWDILIWDLILTQSSPCFQRVLASHGAAKISAYVTHGIFPNRSFQRFEQDKGGTHVSEFHN